MITVHDVYTRDHRGRKNVLDTYSTSAAATERVLKEIRLLRGESA